MHFDMPDKSESRLMLPMALLYGTIIIFPAYGPILALYVNQESALFLSTLFLFTFSACIFLLPRFSSCLDGKLCRFLCLAAIIMSILFPAFGLWIKSLSMVLLGFFTARIVLLWSIDYLSGKPALSSSRFLTSILFFSYAILYFFNALSPNLPKSIAIFFPAAAFSLIYAIYGSDSKPFPSNRGLALLPPVKYLFPIFLIYISAGITYSGVYPKIAQFSLYERYYNVLPFLATLPFAYHLHKRRGVKALLWAGMSLLGLSFLFHVYELKLWNYLIIQTLLQAGWAFMNSFVWLFASSSSRINRNPYYFSSIMATFLMGTSMGSALYILTNKLSPSTQISFLGLLPILGVLVFTQMIPDNLNNDIAIFESSQLEVLTRREREIFLMLLDNMKNKDIAEALSISPNTLKKHCGNIYRKLYVENKTELIKVYGNMETAN